MQFEYNTGNRKKEIEQEIQETVGRIADEYKIIRMEVALGEANFIKGRMLMLLSQYANTEDKDARIDIVLRGIALMNLAKTFNSALLILVEYNSWVSISVPGAIIEEAISHGITMLDDVTAAPRGADDAVYFS